VSAAVNRSGGLGATLAVALVGFALGAAIGWGRSDVAVDLASLEEKTASAMRIVDPVQRRGELLEIFAMMSPETLPAIRAGLESEFQFADKCVVPPFTAAWASFDPVAAFEGATTWDHAAKRSQATSEVVYLLARTDRVDRARALAGRLALDRVRNPTYASIAEGMLRGGDLEGATEYLVEHPDSADRNRIIERFLQYFTLTGDLDGLIAWVDEIGPDAPNDLRRSAFPLAARWMSSVNPERAAAWVDAQPDTGPSLPKAHVAVASEWLERDPDAAMSWLLSRTKPGKRKFELRAVLRRLIDRDPVQASAWLERQMPLEDLELGIPLLVRAMRDERPQEALAWAGRLTDERERNELVAFVAGEWLARDPEEARGWLAESNLSEGLRAQIESESVESAEDDTTWQ
jgi:hypothetical protein